MGLGVESGFKKEAWLIALGKVKEATQQLFKMIVILR